MPNVLLNIPPEILLYIFSFLDIPDLAALSKLHPYFSLLTSDPLLHRTRLLVVAPSRVSHALFALGPQGLPLRPTVADLVHWGVMKGFNIERRWRMGLYFYSPLSVINYESSVRLQRRHASNIVSSNLRRRTTSPGPNILKSLHITHIYPDVESSSPSVSRSLLPVMRQLKWSLKRDTLARIVRSQSGVHGDGPGKELGSLGAVGKWIESRSGTILAGESERIRLAIPGPFRSRLWTWTKSLLAFQNGVICISHAARSRARQTVVARFPTSYPSLARVSDSHCKA
ncbi:uncharacterized protein STEHIDRAFT_47225 [Stereum hirsutum FP-91666 SS1]|uniref:uncharacterized protein n=1 Tax=Stereum hirsutum (strain FP-91666) TaxID=721885 RepID=UPI000440DC3B|nr:uncharacterized protein STEHIDRAFT_47225 [Stereum hirsutum FP-91666 SS1]EIM92194.1 hypothetical protein STEHIDRAFT_47225 [Stereum hirsutum FP-91666 SS1]